ncbi:HAD family hydrolase [Spirosoma montaniterrae]|uniref:Haloacid dehalogenase n=1 Tax=Spirosoma montaniterrae TaxID=1178516 RepID=A0A1P9X418_9BACT|nr:HAD family phosphatase [Spirosoma montaniterrae]AQG82361.1 haloacid dehalogenase [Spirosoma montaniterrae]
MPTPPFAALFDMDGVLIDNTDFHINAWLQFSQHHNNPITKEQYIDNINGRVSADAMAYVLKRTVSGEELVALTEEKEGIYRDLYRSHLQPAPGLLAFLDVLKAANARLAVGTSAPASNVDFTLDGLTIRNRFDAIVDASMVRHGKPNPEIYLTAAGRVGVLPGRCVVFEDAFAGIEAGLRAGMTVIALATTHTHNELQDTGAALIINDFTELTVEQLLALLDEESN